MNAIQFIKEHGVGKAREVVEGAPEWAIFWITQGEYHISMLSFPNMVGHHSFLISDLKRLVESGDIISKFDSVQEAKDAIANAPEGATEFRKLSCSTRYIKVGPRFFEYWDGFNWCRLKVPLTDETNILRFTQLSRLEQAIADYESIYSDNNMVDCEILDHPEDYTSPNCKKFDERVK